MKATTWDLTALLNAADPKASRPERHRWLVRLLEWLRHGQTDAEADGSRTPKPVLRLKHLLNMLERNPEPRSRIVALLGRFWRETDLAALLADFGFSSRSAFANEFSERLQRKLLPATPETSDASTLFLLVLSRAFDRRTPSHQCGTARMGEDPATSVVDGRGRAHQVKNLILCDASVLPTSAAVNPSLTIAALALRTA
jgi:choline dehydrogenase-like flavoprotein